MLTFFGTDGKRKKASNYKIVFNFIEENWRLGSGYNIAHSDMGIRGSGHLFGYKQSGSGNSVGYEMYLRLIQNTLHSLGKLNTPFIILPEDVLIDVWRMSFRIKIDSGADWSSKYSRLSTSD